jgi:Transposase
LLVLYSRENVPKRQREEFNTFMRYELKIWRAWAVKNGYINSGTTPTPCKAGSFSNDGTSEQHTVCRNPFGVRRGRFRRNIHNILTYCQHPVTLAMSERLNRQIQMIEPRTYGFCNTKHFKTTIYFHYWRGLDQYPR